MQNNPDLPLIIVGAGGHAREIYSIAHCQGYNKIFFFDDITTLNILRNCDVLKSVFELNSQPFENGFCYIIATGSPKTRKILHEKFASSNGELRSIIAHNSTIDSKSRLGKGLNIMQNSFISCDTQIGDLSLINSGAMIHHDVEIGEYCEICPRATLLGNVKIGGFTMIGTGSIILPGIEIGENCIIGAGSVITKNIPPYSKGYGNPFKIIKKI